MRHLLLTIWMVLDGITIGLYALLLGWYAWPIFQEQWDQTREILSQGSRRRWLARVRSVVRSLVSSQLHLDATQRSGHDSGPRSQKPGRPKRNSRRTMPYSPGTKGQGRSSERKRASNEHSPEVHFLTRRSAYPPGSPSRSRLPGVLVRNQSQRHRASSRTR